MKRWERIGFGFLALFLLAFGVLTELRSCYQNTRKTDFGIYLRAAYAVRSGADIYQARDDNGYRYTYPPAFAVLLTPLADAPAGVPRDGLVPYPLSVAFWITLNFLLVARIVHVLAGLLLPNEPRGSRRWWCARTVPFYVASGGLLYSIGFGQVNVLLVAMLVEMLRSRLSGRSLQAGGWLAAAIVLKVIPAYLLLYPLLLRDKRFVAGIAAGLIVGLVVIPVAGLGVPRTVAAYQNYAGNILLPGVTGTTTPDGPKELLAPTVNDSQSFFAVFSHRASPIAAPEETGRLLHNLISIVLTLATLLIAWRSLPLAPAKEVIFVGALMLLMVHVSPMSHMHYYAFGVVVAAGLWLDGLSRTNATWPGWRVWFPLALWGVGTALPYTQFLSLHGQGPACSIVLWVAAMMALAAGTRQQAATSLIQAPAVHKMPVQ